MAQRRDRDQPQTSAPQSLFLAIRSSCSSLPALVSVWRTILLWVQVISKFDAYRLLAEQHLSEDFKSIIWGKMFIGFLRRCTALISLLYEAPRSSLASLDHPPAVL